MEHSGKCGNKLEDSSEVILSPIGVDRKFLR